MSFIQLSGARGRTLVAAALAATMFVPATASLAATSQGPTGTIVGSVTCGPAEEQPAAQATVSVQGLDVTTSTDGAGKFTLQNVPSTGLLSITALADPQGSVSSTRYDVTVPAGTVTDIGNLDLSVCPQPQPAQQSDTATGLAPDQTEISASVD